MGQPTHDPLEGAFDQVSEDGEVQRLNDALEQRLFNRRPAPTNVGRYELGSRIGEGGMGVVHQAHDPELNRKVAVKLLTPGGNGDTRRQTRLLREAEALAAISHPNVVAVFDVGLTESDRGSEVYLVMEYIGGVTLARWLREPRTPQGVIAVFLDAGEGIVAAHAQGLTHRDFKPANVMIDAAGRVRVLDFGLAHAASGESSGASNGLPRFRQSVTATGTTVGTPAYMAPEQWHGGSVGAAADQYAFCVALEEALFGERRSIDGTTTTTGPALEIDSNTERRLRLALQRGLHSAPRDRYPSMAALLAALAEAAAPPRRTGARAAVLMVVGGLALAAALPGVWSGASGPEDRARAATQLAGVHAALEARVGALRMDAQEFERARTSLESAHLHAVESGLAHTTFETAVHLAEVHRRLGANSDEVREWLRRADAHREQADPTPQQDALLLSLHAEVALEQGDAALARRNYEEAAALAARSLGEGHPVTLMQRSKLLHQLIQMGDTAAIRREAELLEAGLPAQPRGSGSMTALLDIGYARLATDDQDGALQIGERVARSLRANDSQDRELLGRAHLLLGTTYANLSRKDEALEQFVAIRKLNPSDFVAMQVESATGVLLCQSDEVRSGIDHLRSNLDHFVERRGPDNSGLSVLHGALSYCYELNGDDAAAAEHRDEAKRLFERVAKPGVDACSSPFSRQLVDGDCVNRDSESAAAPPTPEAPVPTHPSRPW